MLSQLQKARGRKNEFIVPTEVIDAPGAIENRVASVPTEAAKALRLVLSYLFLSDGPTNLRTAQYSLAEPYLTEYEKILARYLKSRTNGSGRRRYGKAGLKAIREAKYKCQLCEQTDVRLLVLDHANGSHDVEAFFVFCANCHQLKSRLFDWTGKKRIATERP